MKDIKKQEKAKNPSLAKQKLNLYMFYGPEGILWDKARNKALCRFRDGKFVTTDIRIIAILLKKKFKFKTKHPVTKKVLNEVYKTYRKEISELEKKSKEHEFDRKKLNSMRISELRILGKTKKVELLQFMTKQEMINRLLGARR